MKDLAIALCMASWFLVGSTGGTMVEDWDRDQALWVQEVVYPQLEHRPNGASIRAVFEKALARDSSAVPGLIALIDSENDSVATGAAKLLGAVDDPRGSVELKKRVATESRILVRASSLLALGRMRDPDAATIAIRALDDPEDVMKGAGGLALGLLGDSANVGALLHYIDVQKAGGEIDEGAFDILAELGDPPGSTIVRDRLLAEANDRANDLAAVRMEAARALLKMGLGTPVQHLLDWNDAQGTLQRLLVIENSVARAAAIKGLVPNSQADLDFLFGQLSRDIERNDLWGRPIRLKLVARGTFRVVSDGPDKAPGTEDDFSTAESREEYEQRIFGDLF